MIEVDRVSHTYRKGIAQEVLHDISVKIPEGSFAVLLGQSGSGKTTLLNIMAGLLKPTHGEVKYRGKSIYTLSNNELRQFRAENVGFVFQNFLLESSFTVRENVMMPLLLKKDIDLQTVETLVHDALEKVGMVRKADIKPSELSGGECQRVSIARALVGDPSVIFADEPTGNLDTHNGDAVIRLLKEQVSLGKTVVMVTHNEKYVEGANQIFKIEDGVIV